MIKNTNGLPQPPGVMLYLDMAEPILALNDEDRGKLLSAILAYAKYGTPPHWDGALGIAWGFIQPRLARDAEAYTAKVLKNQYAAYCRHHHDAPTLDYEAWLTAKHPAYASACDCTPNTATTSTTDATIASEDAWRADDSFCLLMDAYPEARRGSAAEALSSYRQHIHSADDAAIASKNLALWTQSAQWAKDDGQYIPLFSNWIDRGFWRVQPTRLAIPTGGSGALGAAELEAIQRVMREPVDDDPSMP